MFCLRVLTLLLATGTSAYSQTKLAQQDLYLDAMRSIAEGRKDDASDALTRMIEQEPQHAGAWLDLAIIQCELGHADEAERLFHIIESRFSPPPGILEVIARQRTQGCKGWQANSHASLMLGRGTDSNVNQGASSPNFSLGNGDLRIDLQLLPEYLPQHDQYNLLSAEYTRDLTPNGSVGFVQFQARQNDALTRYNTASAAVGLEIPWRIANWGVRGTGTLGALTLGGKLYQKQTLLQARVSPPVTLPDSLQFSIVAGLTHVEYPTLTDFNANTLELRSLLSYRTERTQTHASIGYLSDRAAGARPGGDRNGWYASLQGRTRIKGDVFGELGWTGQTWVGQSAYSPGLIDAVRHQQTQIFRGALIVPVTDRQSVHLELRQVRNNENISIFQYNDRQLQLTWQWQNF